MSPESASGFSLHPRLEADTHRILDWPLSQVLLMDDVQFPWLILVPRINGLTELHQLPTETAGLLMGEIQRASGLLQEWCRADKINVGALGNLVPQLHVHVIARFTEDPAWPGPVWGKLPARRYARTQLQERLKALRALLRE
jgi:diadenosine tetraphosphate (Ap4A) HIT family hydrolase